MSRFTYLPFVVNTFKGRTEARFAVFYKGTNLVNGQSHPVLMTAGAPNREGVTTRKLRVGAYALGLSLNKDGTVGAKLTEAIHAQIERQSMTLASPEETAAMERKVEMRSELADLDAELAAEEAIESVPPTVDTEELVELRAAIARLGETIEAQAGELAAFRHAEEARRAAAERQALIESITAPLMAEIKALKGQLAAKAEESPVNIEANVETAATGS